MSKRTRRALVNVSWGQHYFGAVLTGRGLPLRAMRRLESDGLVESVGSVAVCDGDGSLLTPERYRDGWRLTAKGIQELVDNGDDHFLHGDWFDRDYRKKCNTTKAEEEQP